MTIPSSDGNDKPDEYYSDEGNDSEKGEDSEKDYLESRPTVHVPPPPFSLENKLPQKVTVRVENYIPLSEDTAQVIIGHKIVQNNSIFQFVC